MLASMRFKNYIWPYNPKTFEMEYRRKVIQHKIPFSGTATQNLGPKACVFKGYGEFAGSNAYKQFKALAEVFREDSPGILSHPLWPSVNAYFTKLELKQEPQEDYVRYSFEFTECSETVKNRSGRITVSEAIHMVKIGETLGSIAADNNTELEKLIILNPNIKNANILAPGTEVKLGGEVKK